MTTCRTFVVLARSIIALGIATLAGCGDPAAAPSLTTANVALVLPDGALISEIAYAVYASDGTTVLLGTKDYTDRSTPLALGLSLTAGTGYVLEIAATSLRGDACDGLSEPFDVVSGQSTNVTMTVACDPSRGYTDQCPVLVSWSATLAPAPAPPGTINLLAHATDDDKNDIVTYAWTAPSGSFSSATTGGTVYTCASSSAALVTLTLDDHHQPSGCTTTAQLPVGCGAAQP